MTQLATGLNTANRPCLASCQGGLYYTNNFDPVKVWYGVSSALQGAGIEGPAAVIGAPAAAAGGFSNGDHEIRYRYKNTKTGYVSNPSPALVYTVSGGNGLLTFTIGLAQDIIPSTDEKVDQIVIEATAIGGGVFYQAGTAANTAASVQVGMADTSLIQQFNSDDAYGSGADLETYSSQIPPLGTILVPYRGRLWVFGDQAYALSGVTFTNGSATVTGTGFNLRWAGRVITRTGDAVSYEIASVASTISMTLSVVYGGSTGSAAAQVVSKFPNRGYYSRIFYPEQFLPNVWARDFLSEQSDQVMAAFGRKDGLYVLGRYSGERLIFNADPSASSGAAFSPLKGRRGCFHQRCFVEVEGDVFAWDRQGMWIVGEKPTHISHRIDRLLESMCDYDLSAQFHVAFEPIARVIKFFFVAAGDDAPKYAAVFEIDTGRWAFHSWLQGITASNIVPTTDGQVRLMLGDENGYTWYDGIADSFDGVPPTSPTVVTVTGSPTNATIPVTETLPTSGVTLAGVMCYNPETGESDYISSNTANEITMPIGFSAAPAVGDELYLGAIAWEYRTKWWTGPSQAVRKNPPFLIITLFPGSATGTARVYFYADFATVPSQLTAFVTDTQPDGVTVANDNYYLEVALDGGDGDGVLSVPVPIQFQDAIQARITSIRPDGALRFLDVEFALTKQGQVSDVGT